MSFYFWDVFYTISSLISDKFHYNIINSKEQQYLVLLKIGYMEDMNDIEIHKVLKNDPKIETLPLF